MVLKKLRNRETDQYLLRNSVHTPDNSHRHTLQIQTMLRYTRGGEKESPGQS